MNKYGLIAGINWAIAATAVVGSVFIMSPIFAPIPPATWPVEVPGYHVEKLQSAKESLPLRGSGIEFPNTPQQSSSAQLQGQQRIIATQSSNVASADPGASAVSNNTANPHPLPDRYPVAPASPSPTPSVGSENLPAFMRYF